MQSLIQTLEKAQQRRRFPDWQPTPPQGKLDSNIPKTVLWKLLEFIDLEVTVGQWIVKSNRDQAIASFIERNAADELKHDKALRLLREYAGKPSTISDEANDIIKRWKAQEPTFALAYALEMGVFMTILPWLNKNGDVYCSTVAGWISDDETVHVVTNAALAKHTGQKLTKAHYTLVRDTLAFIGFEPNVIQRAFKRLQSGKDRAMMNESVAITPAFFEQSDKRSTEYV